MAEQLALFSMPAPVIGPVVGPLPRQAPMVDPRPSPTPLGTKLFYAPAGRALEYAQLACNLYTGCSHGCLYCYAVRTMHMAPSEFVQAKPRKGQFLTQLEREASILEHRGITGPVTFCFTCDPYQPLELTLQVTRQAIQIAHRHGIAVETLTKGGTRALRDLELFGPGDAFASTLTLLDQAASERWEPKAASPENRLKALRAFHAAGITTWVSLEPVLDPAVTLEIIRHAHEYVDMFKVGKLNYHPLARSIKWGQFGRQAIRLLQSLGYTEVQAGQRPEFGGRSYYIKADLKAEL